ncbi:hypothetical protein SANTM175S_09241 [Streptomyces antimycoticus]
MSAFPHSPPQPTTLPSSHPVAVVPHTVEQAWFRGVKVERATVRTTLTPLGRVCSALPGTTVTGWEPPAHATTDLRAQTEPRPSRSLSAPAGGIVSGLRLADQVSPLGPPALSPVGARRRTVRGAGRRQEQSATGSRERARRSGAQPGVLMR